MGGKLDGANVRCGNDLKRVVEAVTAWEGRNRMTEDAQYDEDNVKCQLSNE